MSNYTQHFEEYGRSVLTALLSAISETVSICLIIRTFTCSTIKLRKRTATATQGKRLSRGTKWSINQKPRQMRILPLKL